MARAFTWCERIEFANVSRTLPWRCQLQLDSSVLHFHDCDPLYRPIIGEFLLQPLHGTYATDAHCSFMRATYFRALYNCVICFYDADWSISVVSLETRHLNQMSIPKKRNPLSNAPTKKLKYSKLQSYPEELHFID